MSDHASGHPDGQRACDDLLEALQAVVPGAERKHAKAMCAFHPPSRANFAYVYHAKTKSRLQVWFPSLATETFEPLRSVHPVIRRKLGTPWADQWAWHFDIDSLEQATDAAEFLRQFAMRDRGMKRPRETRTTIAEEIDAKPGDHLEGAVERIVVNRFERDPKARERCIQHHGAKCQGCGFSFAAVYGAQFHGLITVHHLKPLSLTRARYKVDPVKDLIPLCANCHLLVHQCSPPYTVQELRALLAEATR
jgi:predicted HNH restriction endonuclease